MLFFISVNRKPESLPPIFNGEVAVSADPLPQAFVLTAIVIGFALTAFAGVLVAQTTRAEEEEQGT